MSKNVRKEYRKKITNRFSKLNSDLNDKKDEHLESISSIINKSVKNYEDKDLWKKSYDDIVDIFYTLLTETYLETTIALRDIYEQISDEIPNIEDFIYTEDDITLPQRIKKYWDEALSLLKESQVDSQQIALYILSMYDRILRTEMANIKTGVKKVKKPISLRPESIEVIVITDGVCCDNGGVYLADDAPALPPYHPDCECDWWYEEYFTYDEADLEELQELGWEEDDG